MGSGHACRSAARHCAIQLSLRKDNRPDAVRHLLEKKMWTAFLAVMILSLLISAFIAHLVVYSNCVAEARVWPAIAALLWATRDTLQ